MTLETGGIYSMPGIHDIRRSEALVIIHVGRGRAVTLRTGNVVPGMFARKLLLFEFGVALEATLVPDSRVAGADRGAADDYDYQCSYGNTYSDMGEFHLNISGNK